MNISELIRSGLNDPGFSRYFPVGEELEKQTSAELKNNMKFYAMNISLQTGVQIFIFVIL